MVTLRENGHFSAGGGFFHQVCSSFLASDFFDLNALPSGTAKSNRYLESSFSRMCWLQVVQSKAVLLVSHRTWPVLSEATFDVRELGTCKGSKVKRRMP